MSPADDEAPPPQITECGMCHRPFPATQTITISGRILCFGCAAGWFDDEDESPDDK